MVDGPGFEEAAELIRVALAERAPRRLQVPGFRPAAVLIPLLRRPDGPTVLFTLRTLEVPHHKGEISFPGGGLAAGEEPEAAALREAEEEVGLAPPRARLLGALDDVPSVWRYVVTPVAAAISDPPRSMSTAFECTNPTFG